MDRLTIGFLLGLMCGIAVAYLVNMISDRLEQRKKVWPIKGVDWCDTHTQYFQYCINDWLADPESPPLMPNYCNRRTIR